MKIKLQDLDDANTLGTGLHIVDGAGKYAAFDRDV